MRTRHHLTLHLLLTVSLVLILGPQQAAAQRIRLGVPLADVNTDAAAENLLAQARNLAATGAFDRAANLYASLAERRIWPVTELEELRYQSIHLAANRDLLSWPAPALEDYRQLTEPHAAGLLDEAVRTGNLADIESVATRYLATAAGARATAILATRLLEQGDFALSVYYFDLLLSLNLQTPLQSDALHQQALRAATMSRIPALRQLIKNKLPQMAADNQPPAPPLAAGYVSHETGDHGTSLPARLPSRVLWQHNILPGPPRNSQYPVVSTPLPYPVARDGRIALVFQTRAMLIDARDGSLIWQYDTTALPPDEPPAQFRFEQAHRPILTPQAMITPISRGDPLLLQIGIGAIVDLVSLDLATGRPQWRWSPPAYLPGLSLPAAETGPLATDHRLFTSVTTMVNFFGEVQMVALDRAAGNFLWRSSVGAHANQVLGDLRETSSMPMTTALAHCGGIVLSGGPGLITAHSAVSGRMLWALQIPMMKSVNSDRTVLEGRSGRTYRNQINDRLPQLLVSDGLVFAGGPVDDAIVCCDILTGEQRWMIEDTTDTRVAALRGNDLITWGSTVSARNIADGEPRWTLELSAGELIAAAPLVADRSIYVPTTRRLLLVDIASGTIADEMVWPAGRLPGNLHLTPQGLLVGEPQALVCYQFHDDAVDQLQAQARRQDADDRPETWLELAEINLRVARYEPVIENLSRAIAAAGDNQATIDAAFNMLRESVRRMDQDSLSQLGLRILELMQQSARLPTAIALQAMESADFHARTDPKEAIKQLQPVFADPQLRLTQVDDNLYGSGPAGVLAERQAHAIIRQIGKDETPQLLKWLDELANQAARSAIDDAVDAPTLRKLAMAHALAPAAREMLRHEARLHSDAKQHAQAADVLKQLLVAMPPGPEKAEVRLLLAQSLIRTGHSEMARFHADAAARMADGNGDSDNDAMQKLADEARRTIARLRMPNPPANIDPPPSGKLKQDWTLTLPIQYSICSTPLSDLRSAKARAAQPLIIATVQGVFAFHRSGRQKPLWHLDLGLTQLAPPVVPMLLLDNLAVFGAANRIFAVNPVTGATRWTADLQPPVDIPPQSLLSALTYGSTIWPENRAKVHAVSIDAYQGYVRVITSHSIHLLDPRDGFSISTAGQADQPMDQISDMPAQIVAVQKGTLPSRILCWDMARGAIVHQFASDARNSPQVKLLAAAIKPGHILVADAQAQGGQASFIDLADGSTISRLAHAPCAQRRSVLPTPAQLIIGLADGRLVALSPEADADDPLWTLQLSRRPADSARLITPLGPDVLVQSARLLARVSPDGKAIWRFTLEADSSVQQIADGAQRILIVGRQRSQEETRTFFEIINAADGASLGRTIVEPDILTPGRFRLLVDTDGLTTIEGNLVRRWIIQR